MACGDTPIILASFARRPRSLSHHRNGQVRHFKPSAKGKWDVLVPSTVQVSLGDRIRVTAGFREGKYVFESNDIVELREITETELVLHDGRRMRRDGARIDQGVCITLMQANAVRSIRWSCCRTRLTQKAGM
jgi:hypothetical protein